MQKVRKMKLGKQILSIMLALFMVLGMMPNTAFAKVHTNEEILSKLIIENSSEEISNVSTESAITLNNLSVDGSTLIENEEDLRAITDMNGFYKLAGDIILTGDWTPIGTSANPFTGNFDGDGHSISGLLINAEKNTYQGLFGKIGKNGTVQNLRVIGEITSTNTGNAFIGGIAGQVSDANIINCINEVEIDAGTKAKKIGGIAGDTTGDSKVIGCANLAAINAGGTAGGVVGSTTGTTEIINCYNSGTINTSSSNSGGVVGYVLGTTIVQNCYNADDGARTGSNSGALIGFLVATSTAKNSYWLGDESTVGIGNHKNGYDTCSFKTSEELKSSDCINSLNTDAPYESRFVFNTGSINEGYPILVYQIPKTEEFEVEFITNPSDALLSVKDEHGVLQAIINGVYYLSSGNYTYSSSAFGYQSENDVPFEVSDDKTIEVNLVELDKQVVSFFNLPRRAIVSVTHLVGGNMEAQSDGSYYLPPGNYSYTVVAKGYEPLVDGEFEVIDTSLNIELAMTELSPAQPWDGTTKTPVIPIEDTYYIKNAPELAWFASETIKQNLLSANVVLLNDIDLGSKSWSSMSTYNSGGNYFKGIFDGNYCTISNLSGESYGLFYRTDRDAVIQNLIVSGSITGSSNVGGIVGVNYGTIRNSSSNVDITATGQRIGGVAGDNSGGKILACVATGTITSSHGTTAGYSTTANIGGISGQNTGTIENCYSKANVSTTGRTHNGNVGGITGDNRNNIKNSYNVGTVSCFVFISKDDNTLISKNTGSIAGDNSNPSAKIENTYYLEGTCVNESEEDLGVGNGSAEGVESEDSMGMKDASFVIALNAGNIEGPFNADEDININDGYPVLKWQGGKTPVSEEDELAVAADKSSLELSTLVFKTAGTIDLSRVGDAGSTITWISSKPEIISVENGNVILPELGIESVVLTATLKKGTAQDSKAFTVTVYSAVQVTIDYLVEAEASLTNILKPVYGVDENIITLVENMLVNNNFPGIDVTLTNPGETSIETKIYIDENGTITYFYEDPSNFIGMKMGIVRNISFKLSKDGQEVTYDVLQANIPWDRSRVLETLQEHVASNITWDMIKGGNTYEDEVTLSLDLPLKLETARWANISWVSDSIAIVPQAQPDPTAMFTTGRVNRQIDDVDVTLTGNISFNLTNNGEPDIILPVVFNLTVLGSNDVDTPEKMLKKLEKYTLERLKDFITKTQLDPNAVKGDIQFPIPANTGVTDFSKYRFTVTSLNTDILEVNGYRGYVYRPLPGDSEETVEFTVTMTSRENENLSVSKNMEVTVLPLEQSEIDEAFRLMDAVKASYASALLGENADKDTITSNLKPFREAVFDEDGETLIYSRHINNDTRRGVLADDLPGSEPGGPGYEKWRIYRSSHPNVLEHEVLRLRQPEYNTSVTIYSCLTHEILGKYALKHPDLDIFDGLYKQEISAVFNVIGEKGEAPVEPVVTQMPVGTAIVVFEEDGSYTVYKEADIVTIDKDLHDAGFTALGALQATTDEYEGEGWITSIYGITGPDTGGWMFTVNGKIPNVGAKDVKLNEGDKVVWFCTYDYLRDEAPTWEELTTDPEVNLSIKIKIDKTTVKVGEELSLVAEVKEDDNIVTDRDIVWSISDPEIAIISDGKIVFNKGGEVTITATLAEDQSIKDSKKINVIEEAEVDLTLEEVIAALREYYFNKDTYTFRVAMGYNYTSNNMENDLIEISQKFKVNNNPKSASEHVGNIIGLIAAGKNPYDYNDQDYVKALAESQGDDGKFIIGVYDDYSTTLAFAILALDMADAQYDRDKAISALISYQIENGSFGGVDETGMCLIALGKYTDEAGIQESINKGLNYLKSEQDDNTGGFVVWGSENPYSVSAVIQGLIAVGENPLSEEWTKNGKTMVDSLMSFYRDGHFENTSEYGTEIDMATEQAFIALADLYRGESMFNEISLNVNELVKIVIQEPAISKIIEGEFIKLFVVGYSANNNIVPVAKIEWSSSDSEIAEVDADGKVVTKKAGEVTITAKVEGKDIMDSITLNISEKEFETVYTGDAEGSNGSTFEAKIQVKNLSDEKKSVALIVALYDKKSNKMLSFEIKNAELSNGELQEISTGLLIPINGDYCIKVFLWDSLENQDIIMNDYFEFDIAN